MKCYLPLSLALLLVGALTASADERLFTYVYEADVLAEGEAEFEQYITNQNGKEDGDFSRWDFRSEIEYGLTSRLMTALYLNWTSVRQDGVTGEEDENSTEFKGFSSEWIYQLVNPNLAPVGFALYGEYSTDGIDHELEAKVLLSRRAGKWELALNGTFEGEFEKDDGEREREATLIFSAGTSYHITSNWSAGLELQNKSAYPGGLDLNGQEFQAWSVGPNVHYGSPKWWATFTVLPQVWGNGEGSQGGRQLVHEESVETRLIFGVNL